MNSKNLSPRALRVRFRHMPQSNSIKELVRMQADRLRRFNLAGSRCEVVIEKMHRRHKGIIFKGSVRLTVLGERLFVAHAEEKSDSSEYLNSAVRLAFDEIERQLEKRSKRIECHRAA